MEQLTKNQAVATSQEAVQNQNEPQLRDENAHNDKSVHGVLNPTYQAGLRRDAVQPDIEAERKKRDEIEAGKSYCSRRFGGATSPLLVMRSNLWASGYDVDGTDQTSLGQFSGRVQQTYKHSVPRFFVP